MLRCPQGCESRPLVSDASRAVGPGDVGPDESTTYTGSSIHHSSRMHPSFIIHLEVHSSSMLVVSNPAGPGIMRMRTRRPAEPRNGAVPGCTNTCAVVPDCGVCLSQIMAKIET